MRRRAAVEPEFPEPPEHLRRCIVEDVLSPQELAQARATNRDVLAAAFIAQREGLREWAKANDVPWTETSKYRSAPRWRAQAARRSRR